MADPDDQQRLAADVAVEALDPAALSLVGDHLGHAVVEHEDGHCRVLGRAAAMDPSAVGEHRAGWQPVERHQVVHAGAVRVHPLEPRRAAREIVARDVPREHHVRRLQPLLEHVAVVADRGPHHATQRRATREGLAQTLAVGFEHRTKSADILDVEMNPGLGHESLPSLASVALGSFPVAGPSLGAAVRFSDGLRVSAYDSNMDKSVCAGGCRASRQHGFYRMKAPQRGYNLVPHRFAVYRRHPQAMTAWWSTAPG